MRGPVLVCATLSVVASCIASAPEGIQRQTDGGGSGGEGFGEASVSAPSSGSGTSDPHAVLGANPPHGPFAGGDHVIITGNGFEPNVRVWFGATEATDVVPIDPTRVQVSAPPGDPETVDISAQNGADASTHRTLVGGYSYDPLFAVPSIGPVSGGTVITIFGKNTEWVAGDVEARVDGKVCTTLDVIGPEELSCTVPKGTPGSKSLVVEDSSATATALDAYTYQDSADGFKGGLSGAPLSGKLTVLSYDNFSGEPIGGAHVIVGSDVGSGLYAPSDATGVTIFNDASLDAPVTVTVAAECHSPVSFVEVPVDTVTVYLDPVLTPACASGGDPPPGGGSPVLTGIIDGELVWPSQQEFQEGHWSGVPYPETDAEKRVAYVFIAGNDPRRDFELPQAANIGELAPGSAHAFSLATLPGNQSVYAIAGILNTATQKFYAYTFGAVKGVAVVPGEFTESVYIDMNKVLDQALTMDVSPPPAAMGGPDRLHATVAVEIATSRFAILPGMQKTPLIPIAGDIHFIGLPPLDGGLTGSRYVASAHAVTGPGFGAPLSVVGSLATTTTSIPLDVSGFVAVPELLEPVANGAWDGRHLAVDYASGGFPADITVYEIIAAGGLMHWTVAVPHAAHSAELPDLSSFVDAALPAGPLVVGVYGARIDDFDYGRIGYRNLRPQGMAAYALSYFNAHL
jgi:hypothetical protein